MDEFDSIEWDESKRLSNLVKHYLDFMDAIHVLRGPYLRAPAKTVEGEVRWMATGMLDDVYVSLIYTLLDLHSAWLCPPRHLNAEGTKR